MCCCALAGHTPPQLCCKDCTCCWLRRCNQTPSKCTDHCCNYTAQPVTHRALHHHLTAAQLRQLLCELLPTNTTPPTVFQSSKSQSQIPYAWHIYLYIDFTAPAQLTGYHANHRQMTAWAAEGNAAAHTVFHKFLSTQQPCDCNLNTSFLHNTACGAQVHHRHSGRCGTHTCRSGHYCWAQAAPVLAHRGACHHQHHYHQHHNHRRQQYHQYRHHSIPGPPH
jgi:hypothetical protein